MDVDYLFDNIGRSYVGSGKNYFIDVVYLDDLVELGYVCYGSFYGIDFYGNDFVYLGLCVL